MKITAGHLRQIVREEAGHNEGKSSGGKPNKIRCPNCGGQNSPGRKGKSCQFCGYAPLPAPNVVAEALSSKQQQNLESHIMKITVGELKRIIREVAASVPGSDVHLAQNDAVISGTSIGTPATAGDLSPQDQDELEAQLRALNSQRQQAENQGDMTRAHELAMTIAKIEKMLNA